MRLSLAAADLRLDQLTALLDGGSLLLYSGARPAISQRAIGYLTGLALGSPAFKASVGAVASAQKIEPAQAEASGTASFFRLMTRAGQALVDGSVGQTGSGADLEVDNVQVVFGAFVAIERLLIDDRQCLED